jgi:membrane protease YdiL (CAAX protease family)
MTFGADLPLDHAAAELPPTEASAHVEPARPLRVWTVFAVFIATVVVSVTAQIPVAVALVLIHIARGGAPQDAVGALSTPWSFVIMALPAQLAILAMWWLATSYGDPRARVDRAIGRASLAWPAYACLAWASLGVLWLGGLLGEAAARLVGDWESDYFTRIFEAMTWPSGLVFILFIAVAPAFVEELFFRGYMQRRLLARLRPAVAIPLVAILFAAFHGTPSWALAVFPIGLWLGILAWRTGSLWPGIVCHAFVNGVVNAWRLGVAMDLLPEEVPSGTYYGGLTVAFACVLLSAWFLSGVNRSESRPQT